jgi:hypothetical protein
VYIFTREIRYEIMSTRGDDIDLFNEYRNNNIERIKSVEARKSSNQ